MRDVYVESVSLLRPDLRKRPFTPALKSLSSTAPRETIQERKEHK
jgi:hypothetical protein